MEVQVNKETICIQKQVIKKEEQFNVEGDVIVPDTKPDILNSINVSGNIIVYKKEIKEDKVKIDGTIDTYIMYLPDSKEDKIRGLNCNLDFFQNIEIPSISEEMKIDIIPKIKEMDCKVINGRKIKVKALIEFTLNVYSNDEIEVISQVNNIENIQVLQKDFSVNSLMGSGKTNIYAKENIKIDPKDEFAEILNININLVNKDIKISYNKVLAKIEAEVEILYLTEDNRVESCKGLIPAVGFIDIQNISEENICDINCEIKDIKIKPNQDEEKSIYVEVEIEENCMVYEKKQINLIQDLYSPTLNVEFSQKAIDVLTNKKELKKSFSIEKEIKELNLENDNLLYLDAKPVLLETKITKDKITYLGEVNLNCIYIKENIVNNKKEKIPFDFSIENTEKNEKIDEKSELTILSSNYDVNGEKINCKIEIEINAVFCENSKLNIIDNIEIADEDSNDEDYDSLILYIAQPGDTLWKIAKKFNSTIDELARINGIQDVNKINIGQKIYIPKFNTIRNENKNEEKISYV